MRGRRGAEGHLELCFDTRSCVKGRREGKNMREQSLDTGLMRYGCEADDVIEKD